MQTALMNGGDENDSEERRRGVSLFRGSLGQERLFCRKELNLDKVKTH